MRTVFGILADPIGHASADGLAWATPAARVLDTQNPSIPIDRDHDHRWVGQVVHLERDRNDRIWAVGHVSDDVAPVVHVRVGDELVPVEHDLYWSPERVGSDEHGIAFLSVALTATPARISPQPVVILDGALSHRDAPKRWALKPWQRELLTRAAAAHLGRGRGAPIVVADDHLHAGRPADSLAVRQAIEDQYERWEGRPLGSLRWRPGRVVGVR